MALFGTPTASDLVPLKADTLDPDDFDPLVPRLDQQAITRCPIRLPWQPRFLPLGMFFRSAATSKANGGGNPFAPQSAFSPESLNATPIVYAANDGSGSFRSSEVMSSSASTDHLSIGAGVGIDLCFLEISVSVHYDRDVMENRDSNKASVTTSYRAGSVAYARSPGLSAEAFEVLRQNGVDGFKLVYGDYYVAGYQIGGDASVLFSTDASSRTEKETLRVSLTIESWFGDYHQEWSKTSTNVQQRSEVRVSAYSTIDETLVSETVQVGTPKFLAAIERGRVIHKRAQGLDDSVAKVLDDIGVKKGKLVTHQQCAQLCERAVVVELLLVPVECLRQVRYWSIAF